MDCHSFDPSDKHVRAGSVHIVLNLLGAAHRLWHVIGVYLRAVSGGPGHFRLYGPMPTRAVLMMNTCMALMLSVLVGASMHALNAIGSEDGVCFASNWTQLCLATVAMLCDMGLCLAV